MAIPNFRHIYTEFGDRAEYAKGRLWAVCPAAEIPDAIWNEFLDNNRGEKFGCNRDLFVIVQNLASKEEDKTTCYTEADAPPVSCVGGKSKAPFRGLSPADCARKLWEMVQKTESDIDVSYFIIADELLGQDNDTVVVCCEGCAFRSESRLALECIMADLGKGLATEFAELAQKGGDGVYRG